MSDYVRYLAVRLIARLPDAVKVRLSGMPPVIVDGQRLDAQAQFLLSMRRRAGVRGLVEPSVAAGRARYRRETASFRGPVTTVAAVRELEIGNGLHARHYAPRDGDGAPLTVYFHGGGLVIGDLHT